MRDEDDRLPLPVPLTPHAQQFQVELVARHRVERAKRLVHEEQRRIEQQRAAQGGALLHAAGQLARELLAEVSEPYEPQQRIGAGPVLGALQARQLGGQQDVLDDAAPPEEHRRLEDHADGGNRPAHDAAVHADSPGGRRPQPGDDA